MVSRRVKDGGLVADATTCELGEDLEGVIYRSSDDIQLKQNQYQNDGGQTQHVESCFCELRRISDLLNIEAVYRVCSCAHENTLKIEDLVFDEPAHHSQKKWWGKRSSMGRLFCSCWTARFDAIVLHPIDSEVYQHSQLLATLETPQLPLSSLSL